jgi:hypothetical protein
LLRFQCKRCNAQTQRRRCKGGVESSSTPEQGWEAAYAGYCCAEKEKDLDENERTCNAK